MLYSVHWGDNMYLKLSKYTQKEKKNYENGKVKIATNITDITNFIRESIKESSNRKIYFGKISLKLANRINKSLGLNLLNYNVSLKSDSIRHIIKSHGKNTEKLRGQVPIVCSDFKLIPSIISEYDIVKSTGLSKSNKPVLTFIKELGDTYYVVNYVSDKHHNLEVQTMWKQKKNFSTVDSAKDSIHTSKTDSGTSSKIDTTIS